MNPAEFSSLHVELFRFMGISSCFSKVDPGFTRHCILYVCWLRQMSFVVYWKCATAVEPPGKVMMRLKCVKVNWKQQGGRNTRDKQWDNARHSSNQKRWWQRSAITERLVSSSSSLWHQTEQNKKLKHVLFMLGNIRTTMKYLELLSMITWLCLRSFVVPLTAEVIGIIKSFAFIRLSWLFIDGCAFHASLIICAFGKLSPESRK